MANKYLDSNGLLYFYGKLKNIFVEKVAGKGLSTNDYTTTEKEKLAGLENYELPTASTSLKGGIKVDGTTISVNGDGVASCVGGGGVSPSSTTPNMDGTAAVGTETTFARGDHVHPSDTSRIAASEKGQANGVATLDGDGLVPSTQLPSYVDDVVEGYYYNDNFYEDSEHTILITGETGKIYVDLSTNLSYRWGGSTYVLITSSDMTPITNTEIDIIVGT